MKQLFSIDTNPKTVKGQKYGYMTGVLYLAPADSASTPELPINVCPMAVLAKCKAPCLNTAGRGAFNSVQAARIAKTRRFMLDRAAFMADVVFSICALIRKASKVHLIPLVRLNGTSDIRWEQEPCIRDGVEYPNVMIAFPQVQFYDYTKIPNRRNLPANYDLTFSYSGVPEFQPIVKKAQVNAALRRIAVVFRSRASIPATFYGRPCVDGDDSDLRHVDPEGVVVALYAKGRARRDTSGFVVNN